MTRLFKSAVLSVAVAATTLAAVADASAGDRWRRNYHNNHYKGRSSGDVVAAGVLGLAAGAIIGGLAARPAYREPVYATATARRLPLRQRQLRQWLLQPTPLLNAVGWSRGAANGTAIAKAATAASIRAAAPLSAMTDASISADRHTETQWRRRAARPEGPAPFAIMANDAAATFPCPGRPERARGGFGKTSAHHENT